jgi:hypothetical protein
VSILPRRSTSQVSLIASQQNLVIGSPSRKREGRVFRCPKLNICQDTWSQPPHAAQAPPALNQHDWSVFVTVRAIAHSINFYDRGVGKGEFSRRMANGLAQRADCGVDINTRCSNIRYGILAVIERAKAANMVSSAVDGSSAVYVYPCRRLCGR